LAGAWYAHRAYTSGVISSDIGAMVIDGKKSVSLAQGTPGGQPGVKKISQYISESFAKYIGALPPAVSSALPKITTGPASSMGGYYGQK